MAVVAMLAIALYGGAAVATGAADEPADDGLVVATSQIGLLYEPPEPRSSSRMIWPVRGAVTGRFGEGRGGHEHAGIDIPIASGTPIRAALDGVVIMREVQDGYGNYTCIAHAGGFSTCYAHQSRFRVAGVGRRVKQGQVIGYVGNTGTSDTPHLHFEVRAGRAPWGEPRDPLKRLPSA